MCLSLHLALSNVSHGNSGHNSHGKPAATELHFAANQWNRRERSHNVASAVSFRWCWGYSCTCLVHWICFPACLKACRLSNLICLDQFFWNYQMLCSYFLLHVLSKNMSILSTSSVSTNLPETIRCSLAISSLMSCQNTSIHRVSGSHSVLCNL